MVQDLRDKVESAMSSFEELVRKVPGYKGYKDKELRREADKLLRLHVARGFEEQLSRLNSIQLELTNRGRLASLVTLERCVMKLQMLIDRIKSASYGYSGLLDAIKVKEKELDALYEFDSQLEDGIVRVSSLLDRLAAAAQAEEETAMSSGDLVALLDELNTTFSHRQDVFLEVEDVGEVFAEDFP